MRNQFGVSQYQKVDVETKVSSSNSHNLVSMLFDGLLENLAKAIGEMQHGSTSKKGEAISSAIKIIDGLRASLDYEQGGEISANLVAMYDYMERRLLEANKSGDSHAVAEVVSLVKQIKSGWDAIPMEMRDA